VAQAENAIKRANDAVELAKTAKEKIEGDLDALRKKVESDLDTLRKKVESDLDTLVSDVRSRFPMLADAELMRVQAFHELSELSPQLDVDQNLYSKTDAITRERLLAIEGFVAVNFLAPASRGPEVIQNLRLLGKFYAGKSLTKRPLANPNAPEPAYDRAFYYYDTALVKSNREYRVLNDVGWLVGTVAPVPDPDGARALHQESLRRRPNQQRALYNLATLLYDRSDATKLGGAKTYLLNALGEPLWEETPNPTMAGYISYNLACVYDALVTFENAAAGKKQLLDDALGMVRMTATNADKIREILRGDLSPTGDLQNLATSTDHAGELPALRSLFGI
jgi:hypothetical protein